MLGLSAYYQRSFLNSFILPFVVLSIPVFSFAQVELFVAPDGSGEECSEASPCSFETARDRVRTENSSMSEDMVVSLRGGRYQIDEPVEFTSEDSGNNGHRIVFRAYEGEQPRLSGGRRVTGWEDAGGGIFKASYTGPYFRQLYVNDTRAVRARIPNKEGERDFGPYYRINAWDAGGRRVRIQAADIESWSGLQEVEMIVLHHWNAGIYRIDHFDVEGQNAWVFYREPENSIDPWSGCCPGWNDWDAYHFENSLDLLDAPGEWFYDRDGQELYYMPFDGENMATAVVYAPATEVLLDFNGADNITFECMVFEHTNWDMPDEARLGVQAGYRRRGGWIRGGIRLNQTENIRFTSNVIRFFGAAGIEFTSATRGNVIEANLIEYIASNGILVNSTGQSQEGQVCVGDSIINNVVTRAAQDYTGGVGICASYANSLVIEHNEVHDLPYTSISVGWGWSTAPTAAGNNIISYNNIHHNSQLHDDGAGIYTLSNQDGTRIVGNWIHDIHTSDWMIFPGIGVYFDEGSSGLHLENTVTTDVDQNFFCNKCTNNTDVNNFTQNQSVIDNAGPQINPPAPAAPRRIPAAGKTAGLTWTFNQGGVMITTGSEHIPEVRIISLSGATVAEIKGNGRGRVAVSGRSLPNGTYVLCASAGKHVSSRSWVVLR